MYIFGPENYLSQISAENIEFSLNTSFFNLFEKACSGSISIRAWNLLLKGINFHYMDTIIR